MHRKLDGQCFRGKFLSGELSSSNSLSSAHVEVLTVAMNYDIASAAYSLWEARGRVNGHDQADWYAAQALLRDMGSQPRPNYSMVDPGTVLGTLEISHQGIHEFFTPSNSWIEIPSHPRTIFDCDRNRRLHFDEGFLQACHRILKDSSITEIAPSHHFPYRDLDTFRSRANTILEAYRRGEKLPPPLFFYPDSYQFEILDGVHRCLAAFELAENPAAAGDFRCADYRIWIGFNHNKFCADTIAHQIWVSSLCHFNNESQGGDDYAT